MRKGKTDNRVLYLLTFDITEVGTYCANSTHKWIMTYIGHEICSSYSIDIELRLQMWFWVCNINAGANIL